MEIYIGLIPGVILSIFVSVMILTYSILLFISQRNLKVNKKKMINKNLNGNKTANYIFNKYNIDTKVMIDKRDVSEKSNYNVYNRDMNILFLSSETYQTKSLSAQAIVTTECARTIVDKKEDCYTPKYMRNCFILLVIFVIMAATVYILATTSNSGIMPYLLMIFNLGLFIVMIAWYLLVNKNEKKVRIMIEEILNSLDYYDDEEKEKIRGLIKDYAKVTLIRKNKVNLKLKNGGNYEN